MKALYILFLLIFLFGCSSSTEKIVYEEFELDPIKILYPEDNLTNETIIEEVIERNVSSFYYTYNESFESLKNIEQDMIIIKFGFDNFFDLLRLKDLDKLLILEIPVTIIDSNAYYFNQSWLSRTPSFMDRKIDINDSRFYYSRFWTDNWHKISLNKLATNYVLDYDGIYFSGFESLVYADNKYFYTDVQKEINILLKKLEFLALNINPDSIIIYQENDLLNLTNLTYDGLFKNNFSYINNHSCFNNLSSINNFNLRC